MFIYDILWKSVSDPPRRPYKRKGNIPISQVSTDTLYLNKIKIFFKHLPRDPSEQNNRIGQMIQKYLTYV